MYLWHATATYFKGDMFYASYSNPQQDFGQRVYFAFTQDDAANMSSCEYIVRVEVPDDLMYTGRTGGSTTYSFGLYPDEPIDDDTKTQVARTIANYRNYGYDYFGDQYDILVGPRAEIQAQYDMKRFLQNGGDVDDNEQMLNLFYAMNMEKYGPQIALNQAAVNEFLWYADDYEWM